MEKESNQTENEPQPGCCGDKVIKSVVIKELIGGYMNKLLLCLTAVTCFSLLNVATASPMTDCGTRMDGEQYREALPFCQKACNLNYAVGCFAIGILYTNGRGVRQDYQQAKTYYEKACNLNYALGCSNLGVLYEYGHGVTRDYQQAKTYYEKACNLNNELGCSNLGSLYANGQGVRQNIQKAKEYYGKACDLGDQLSCDNYRKLNVATADPVGNCNRLMENNKDREAIPFCEEACNQNVGKGCLKLGNNYLLTDSRKSLPYSEKACNLNEAEGCFNVAWIYEKGQRVRQSFQKAKEYYGKSCDLGYAHGCSEYRRLNEKGY